MAQLPGFEAIEEPKEDEEVLPSTSEEGPKIAKLTPEDLNRNLMNKEAQDILKSNGYDNLPSHYLKEDISTIDNLIDGVNSDLEDTSKAI